MPRFYISSQSPAPFVKICGLTSRRDADLCMEAGVDAIGINFFPGSKRYHPLSKAREWLHEFSGEGFPARVALFVNAGIDEIRAASETGLFEAIQLHGDESPEFCATVRSLGLPLIRALALRSEGDMDQLSGYPADAFILDAYAPGIYGGTGHLSDWALAANAVRRFPLFPILLSGGLTPENIAAAISDVNPAGVDVASGVESAPGVKDPAKVEAFVAAAKGSPVKTRLFR
jgi:phosphoribosylanthranilate isomerase